MLRGQQNNIHIKIETKQQKTKQERAKIRNYYKKQQNGKQEQKYNFLQNLQGFFITTRVADNYSATRTFYQALRMKTVFTDIENWKQEQYDKQEQQNQQNKDENQEQDNQKKNQFVNFDKLLPGAKQTLMIIIPQYSEEQFGQFEYTVQDIYKQLMIAKNEQYSFNQVAKFYPVNNTCRYADQDIRKTFQQFAQQVLQKYANDQPFKLYIKIRCNDQLDKDKKNVRQYLKQILQDVSQFQFEDKNGDIEMSQEIQNIVFINVVRMNVLIGLL